MEQTDEVKFMAERSKEKRGAVIAAVILLIILIIGLLFFGGMLGRRGAETSNSLHTSGTVTLQL